MPYFVKYYRLKPKNINDIKNMVMKVQIYLKEYLKNYEIKKK